MPAVGEWSLHVCSHLQCDTAAGSNRRQLHMRCTSGYAEISGIADPTLSAAPLHLCVCQTGFRLGAEPNQVAPADLLSHPEYSRYGTAEWNAKA